MLCDKTIITVTEIVQVTTVNESDKKFVVLAFQYESLDEELCKHFNISSKEISEIVSYTENIICCLPEKIKYKCLIAPINDDKFCVFRLPNNFERD